MGNMRFKVGDRVRIKSLDWYNENKNHCGEIPLFKPSGLFVPDMSRYCNNIMTIKDICYGTCYRMKEDFWHYNWTDEMIEGLAEEETKSENGLLDEYEELADRAFKGGYEKCKSDIELNGFLLPEGYIFKDENGNVINTQKIVLEKKKPKYPQSYEECCKVLEIEGNSLLINTKNITDYERDLGNLMGQLHRLIICRDAYWKIAGEEMGLGKPWKPDWKSLDPQYIILYQYGGIDKAETHGEGNYILTFPTAEMRDAFKENFDPDIKICKELL